MSQHRSLRLLSRALQRAEGTESLSTSQQDDSACLWCSSRTACPYGPSLASITIWPSFDEAQSRDPNEIKVVVNRNQDALYFSRHPLPWHPPAVGASMFKQVCIIPFRRAFLRTFARLGPTPLEEAESIDMLRVVEHGFRVRMARTAHATCSVDTPEDLSRVARAMRADPLVSLYSRSTS